MSWVVFLYFFLLSNYNIFSVKKYSEVIKESKRKIQIYIWILFSYFNGVKIVRLFPCTQCLKCFSLDRSYYLTFSCIQYLAMLFLSVYIPFYIFYSESFYIRYSIVNLKSLQLVLVSHVSIVTFEKKPKSLRQTNNL